MTVQILVGDVRERLRDLPADSIDLVVTSPPYWGLRDYGVPGQIGLEATLAEHLEVMVDVFREVWRVLKPTGTLYLNYGDCYATTPNGRSAADTKEAGDDDRTFRDKPFSTIGAIGHSRVGSSENLGNTAGDGIRRNVAGGFLKSKDLCMIPNRLAIALQDDGWWVRSEIIWGKLNPMPDSSGAQRPSTSHEKIFLLAKSDDGDVWRARDTGELSFAPNLDETCPLVTDPERSGARWLRIGSYYDAAASTQGAAAASIQRWDQNIAGQKGSTRANGGRKTNGNMKAVRAVTPRHEGNINHTGIDDVERGSRYLRNFEPASLPVWEMATESFKGAHFATFPTDLARRAIIAGSARGAMVLDPFGGAGTVGLVADRLGRNAIMIELNPEYAAIARGRIEADAGLFSPLVP